MSLLKQQQGLINKAIIFLALMAFALSFTTRFDIHFTRTFGVVWNLGHIVAFYLWTYLCLRYTNWLTIFSFRRQLFIVLLTSLLLGAGIEVIQVQVGRSAEIGDLLSDVLGALLAVLFHSPKNRALSPRSLTGVKWMLIICILVLHRDLIFIPINDFYVNKQFPVLLDPITPFEATRLHNESLVEPVHLVREDQPFFEIKFSTAQYSTLMIRYFPKDWSGYKYLVIELFNPQNEIFPITCRINDLDHLDNDEEYSDRFNQRFLLSPGFNEIKVEINEIQSAPARREIKLDEIVAIGLFTIEAKAPKTLQLHKIELKN